MEKDDKWYDNHNEVVAFAISLEHADKFKSQVQVISYFQKPWSHNNEHKIWKTLGKPKLPESNFSKFADALEMEIRVSKLHGDISESLKKKLEDEVT